jgi:hypothetical protein
MYMHYSDLTRDSLDEDAVYEVYGSTAATSHSPKYSAFRPVGRIPYLV